MRISTKGLYAIRMLLDLAEHQNCGNIALKDIAERQQISKKYLEQIIPVLNNSGILRTVRGSMGGYQLAGPPEKYTVGDILRLTEGTLSPVPCADEKDPVCSFSEKCAVLPVWQGLNRVITEYLDGITLQDILDNSRELGANDYVI